MCSNCGQLGPQATESAAFEHFFKKKQPNPIEGGLSQWIASWTTDQRVPGSRHGRTVFVVALSKIIIWQAKGAPQ